MKYAGYIGTAFALAIAGFIQFQPLDQMVKFLSWTVPTTIGVVGWIVQLYLNSRKVKQAIVDEVARKAVDEIWNRMDTMMALKKTTEETPKETPDGSKAKHRG